ncbi:MAG: AAA family ATPase, partial [Clostridia bacterium]|nr:AAA family ATPase [Clostridia bacterium]
MRYYSFSIFADANDIKENAAVNLKNYDYDSPIAAMNQYMYRNVKNGLIFFAYREEENATLAAFAYDEKRFSFEEAYGSVGNLLKEAFRIGRTSPEPDEITMQSFYDCGMEAKRRGIAIGFPRMNEDWFLDLFHFYADSTTHNRFSFSELVVPLRAPGENRIFDGSFQSEMDNVAAHAAKADEFKGNPVHYFLSAQSRKAALEMTEALAYRLWKAGRISGRRISIIGDLDPDLYQKTNFLENIIENNRGGIVVIDLSVRFGKNPSEYVMTAEYIAGLFRRYRNTSLFFFTYDTNAPGFSYLVLPQIRKYAVPVLLREGEGDRKAAVRCMKALIKESDLAQYAEQAKEFMKNFPGDSFTQTAVLEAFEQFEPWCVNRNILGAYAMSNQEEFLLDRTAPEESSYGKLKKLVGLQSVKRQIDELLAANLVWKERRRRSGSDGRLGSMHTVFAGAPGTAKTTVARLFAGIGKEKGLLKSGAFVERGGMDLNGSPDSIRAAFTEAKGGVLFIDEAYAMFSYTAVSTLIQEMENNRDDVIVILAGYGEAMDEFLKLNDGLKSRIPYRIDFPNYTPEELTEIFRYTAESLGFDVTEDAVKEARFDFEKACTVADFGNGRYVRNLAERAIKNQSTRLYESGKDLSKIPKKELYLLTREDLLSSCGGAPQNGEAESAMTQLENMIGLASVKDVIRKAVAHYKMNRLLTEKGFKREKATMHLVFTGNPGTAKTTVARLFAQILKDEKVLPTGKFIEVGRADLVGPFVGSTA